MLCVSREAVTNREMQVVAEPVRNGASAEPKRCVACFQVFRRLRPALTARILLEWRSEPRKRRQAKQKDEPEKARPLRNNFDSRQL